MSKAFEGFIDHVHIYDRALSDTGVKVLSDNRFHSVVIVWDDEDGSVAYYLDGKLHHKETGTG